MSEKKGSIVFRRIRGRIVPVRVKDTSEAAKGVAMVGIGSAIAGAGGRAHRRLGDYAEKLAKKGFQQQAAGVSAARKATAKGTSKAGLKALKKSRAIFKIAPKIAMITRPFGISVAALGAVKAYQSLSKDRGEVGTTAAALTGGSLAISASARGMGSRAGFFKTAAEILYKKVKKRFF